MENKEFTVTDTLLASKGDRFLNYLIDSLIVYIVWISIGTTIILIADITNNDALSERIETMTAMEHSLSFAGVMMLYYLVMEIYFSRTLAKYFTKTVVAMRNGSKPTTAAILKRTLCRFIPFEAFTFLGSKSRGWHDSFSHTYVVKKHKFLEKKQLYSTPVELL